MSSPNSKLLSNIDMMDAANGYDVVIICTSTEHQAVFWQERLVKVRGQVIPANATVIAVHEDWNGGAGNGLGTLYAYTKAVDFAKENLGMDLTGLLEKGEVSVAMYHTAGKGTRLAPLPGSENNNKPGVKLPAIVQVDNNPTSLTILEAVIKQTGVYAGSRRGRLSVFWGDQVFIPSAEVSYSASHHVDILAALGPMPSAEEWISRGLEKYGLIIVNSEGNAAQVDKVTHSTALRLLSSFGEMAAVGTSLGSFSVSAVLLSALLSEFGAELAAKTGKLDADPHFWMPFTLERQSYVEVMGQKNVDAETASAHFDRMARMRTEFFQGPGAGRPLFGAVDVGSNCYWWDYGQLRLYVKNNMLLTNASDEAVALRRFLGVSTRFDDTPLHNVTPLLPPSPPTAPTDDTAAADSSGSAPAAASPTPKLQVDESSVVLASMVNRGRVVGSVMSGVTCGEVDVTDCLLVNVTARRVVGRGCILYNVVDDSEEGLVLEDGAVVAGNVLSDGAAFRMRSKVGIDGGTAWKQVVESNAHSFEQVYDMNAGADVRLIEKLAEEKHNEAARSLVEGLLEDGNLCRKTFERRLSSDQISPIAPDDEGGEVVVATAAEG